MSIENEIEELKKNKTNSSISPSSNWAKTLFGSHKDPSMNIIMANVAKENRYKHRI
jgi:hypothetical protein